MTEISPTPHPVIYKSFKDFIYLKGERALKSLSVVGGDSEG